MVKVSEIFISVQGEGPLMGNRCLFVRLAGCNLLNYCGPFCDTKLLVGIDVDVDCVARSIEEIIDEHDIRYVIITGGEPLLQKDEIFSIIENVDRNVLWQFESNATISVDLIDVERLINKGKKLVFVLSPKNGIGFDPSYFTLYKYAKEYGSLRVCFKFVVKPSLSMLGVKSECPFYDIDSIVNEIERLLKFGISRNDIWLMPAGANLDELENESELVFELARQLDVNFSDRLQVRYKCR